MKKLTGIQKLAYEVAKNFSTEVLVDLKTKGSALEKEIAEMLLEERGRKTETKLEEALSLLTEVLAANDAKLEIDGEYVSEENLDDVISKIIRESIKKEDDEVELVVGGLYFDRKFEDVYFLSAVDYCDGCEEPVVVLVNIESGNRLVEPLPISLLAKFLDGVSDHLILERMDDYKLVAQGI